jgi:UTP--glucose-1-phosphate uridylyltransferase
MTNSLQVKKAIIPAGGLGSRFLPVSAAIPKEMFPVFDKPLIHYAIEELKDAGVEEVYIVVSPWKLPLFESFFNMSDRYSRLSADPSKKSVLQKLEFFKAWPKVTFVLQTEAKGLAEAIGLCRSHIGDAPFFVVLPDEVFVSSKTNPSQSLLASYQAYDQSVVGLFEIPKNEVQNYGIAALGSSLSPTTYELKMLVEKPSADKSPSCYMLPGRYIFKSDFWQAIEQELSQIGSLTGSQELHITNAMDRMASDNLLLGEVVTGQRYDAGRPEGLLSLSQFEFSKS